MTTRNKLFGNKAKNLDEEKPLKEPKNVVIKAKKWFDTTYGNTYHSAEVYVNGKLIGRKPFVYGYGDQYRRTASDILKDKGYSWSNKALVFVDDVKRKKDL